jgi:hypothetical protein
MAYKCARVAEGCSWHAQPTLVAGKANKPDADAAAQSNSKKKKKKKKVDGKDKLLVAAPTAVVAAAVAGEGCGPRGDKWP